MYGTNNNANSMPVIIKNWRSLAASQSYRKDLSLPCVATLADTAYLCFYIKCVRSCGNFVTLTWKSRLLAKYCLSRRLQKNFVYRGEQNGAMVV